MEIVLFTALGVGMSTIFGGVLGFIFQKTSQKFNDIILAFSSGIMLCASILGLILPSLEYGGNFPVLVTVLGIICGAVLINLCDKLVPQINTLIGNESQQNNKVLLFVLAIAIHNLPEGIATGVAFGADDVSQALTVAIGIALQNLPEGMVIISPLLGCGFSKKKTFLIAVFTGFTEIFGTFLGYFAISVTRVILPFALALAGGTMIYVICDEMIPESHVNGKCRSVSYAILIGFCVMLAFDYFI